MEKDTLVGGIAGSLLTEVAYGIEKVASDIGNAIKGKRYKLKKQGYLKARTKNETRNT